MILRFLDHPNITKFIDRIENRRNIHLVMSYAGKSHLKQFIDRRRGPPDRADLLGKFLQLTDAVQYMHENNYSHRDLKLNNVVLSEDGEKMSLVDFGFSILDDGKIQSYICGTPNYMAPELLKKESHLCKPTDVWALGVILWYMLTKEFPFRGRNHHELFEKTVKIEELDFELIGWESLIAIFKGIFLRNFCKRLKVGELRNRVVEVLKEAERKKNGIG
jgi:serine/threonine protein kinase